MDFTKEEIAVNFRQKFIVQFYLVITGQSKMAAKNNASEKALRDIIIQRMLQSPKAQALKPGTEGPQLPSAGMKL